ncbi:GNAT family N-acetyltransferase [Litorilituus sediminis]|nr:GNAT family N-acetyltransferase [Litorilituus sediminis]
MSLAEQPLSDLSQLNFTQEDNPQFFPRVFVQQASPFNKISKHANQIIYVRARLNNYAINLERFNSFEQYLAKFSAKSRSTLKRKVKKAVNSGVIMRTFCTPDDVDIFLRDARFIGNKTYQKKLFDAAIPETSQFKEAVIKQAQQGCLLAAILYKENEPIAYLYCPQKNQSYMYTYLGYLPKYQQYSPGTVLQYLLLEHIFSLTNKAKYFDFTEGDGEHKKLFSSELVSCCNCLVINNNSSDYFWLKLQCYFDTFSAFIGKILSKLRVKQTVKRLIRRST